ncbi:MAG: hypothetical protein JSS02_07980 [Planctomycetes bacterium]|nr:hypothetical protein [Planctomycetota bacterium]
MFIPHWLASFQRLSVARRTAPKSRRRSADPIQIHSQAIQLEDRCLLSFTPVLQGTVGSLDQVLYTLSTSTPKIPADIPVKLVTIMNNSPNTVYPILIDANSTQDFTAGKVVRITLTNGGSGYNPLNPPTVVFTGGGGVGATAKAAVDAQGHVYALTLGPDNLPVGANYTSAPTMSFDDSANGNKGSGASATATISVAGSYTKATSQYDPLDPLNEGYRGYIGEVDANNPNQVNAGLRPYSQVTIQLPLVFWDGARIFMATNGTGTLQSASDPGNPIQSANPWQYNFSAAAYMPTPGTPYSATFADPATGVSNANGRVLWYHDSNILAGGPKGFANDTPGQLTEYTIRDPLQVTWAPDTPQSELANPILNYDVSYVDELGLPAMMETTDGYPKTDPQVGTAPYAGIGADLSVPQMQRLIAAFTQSNPGTANSLLGDYFGGKGYDSYLFPGSLSSFNLLPGGFNVFADSALADSESTYNGANFHQFKLRSGGSINRGATGNVNGNGVVTVGSNVVTSLDPSVVRQLIPGMIVLDSGGGPGNQGNYFSAGTEITSVDLTNNTVTLSTPAYFPNSGNGSGTFALTFLGSQWTSVTGSTDGTTPQITGLDANSVQYLTPGMLVAGPGISTYAKIQSITSSTSLQLVDENGSPVIPAAGSGSSDTPYSFSGGPSSYVAAKLIDLWYAWADYYVQNVGATTQSLTGTTTGTNNLLDANALIMTGLSDTSQLKVGDIVTGPNIALNRVTDVQILSGGTGYKPEDVLTVSGGTTIAPFGAATVKVISVNGQGAPTNVQVLQTGSYSTLPTGPAAVTGGSGSGATLNLTISNTTITHILSATSIQMSNAVLTSATGSYTFSPPQAMPRSSDAPAFGDPANTLSFDGTFTAPYGENPLAFAQTVYDVMSGFSKIPPSGAKLSLSAQLLSYCIGCNIGSFAGNSLVPVVRQNQLRDELKSIMRGVSDFQTYPEFGTISNPVSTSQWYPNPATALTGALLNGAATTSNVFNLNPYVFFVHRVLGMNGYGFSVDDDTADVGSLGSNLEMAYGSTAATAPGSTQQLQNLNYYTSGTPYGTLVGQGQIDNTSVAFAGIRTNGFTIPGNTSPTPVTVIRLPTNLIPRLVAADQNVTGALATASDNSLPAGTRVVAYQNSVSDPSYPPNYGAVFVSRAAGTPPNTDGPPDITFTFTGFNTLLPVVSSFSQPNASPGTQITITGDQFGYTPIGSSTFIPSVLSVNFNGIPVAASAINVIDRQTVKVTVPVGASTGKVAVRSDAGTGYSATNFGVVFGAANTPTVTSANSVAFPVYSLYGAYQSNTTLTVANASQLTTGMVITGPGIAPNTTITVIGNTLTLDHPASQSSGQGMFVCSGSSFLVTSKNATNLDVVGDLPAGVTFTDQGDGTALIAGAPAFNTGTFPIQIVASDSAHPGQTSTQDFTLIVNSPPLLTATINNTPVTGVSYDVGDAHNPQIKLTAEAPFGTGLKATLTVTGLPQGVAFAPGTGIISGKPASGSDGVYPLVFTARNALGTSVLNFTLTVNQTQPSFLTAASTTFTVGQAGNFLVRATGYPTLPTLTANLVASGVTFTSVPNVTTPGASLAGSTTVTVTSAIGIQPGMIVLGPGMPHDTTVLSVAGNLVTLSTSASPGAGAGQFQFGGLARISSTAAAAAQVKSFVITASIGNKSTTQAFKVTVQKPALAIISAAQTAFQAGSPGTFTVVATGSPAPVLTATGLPSGSGLTLIDNHNGTATLSGTPRLADAGKNFTLTITAAIGTTKVKQTLTLSIVKYSQATGTVATFTTGKQGAAAIVGSFPAGTTFTVINGKLPAGVTLTRSAAGNITVAGKPLAGSGGRYSFQIVSQNSSSAVSPVYTIVVNQPQPLMTSAAKATFVVGQAVQFQVSASGFPLPTLAVLGQLPAGIVFTPRNNGTASFTGTPRPGTGGTYKLTLTADNGIGIAVQQFVLTIQEPPLFTSAQSDTFQTGQLNSFLVTTTGSPAAVFSIGGTLPPGVKLVAQGNGVAELQGTPTKTGTFRFFITATSDALVVVQEFTLTIV